MTSFSPVSTPVNAFSPIMGYCQDGVATPMSQEGFSLFLEENNRHVRRRSKPGNIAKSKGVSLPEETSSLPDKTIEFLDDLGIVPDFINSSQEDSLIIEFTAGGNYHLVEFFSDGEIVLLIKGDSGTDAWDLTSSNYYQKLKQELLVETEAGAVE